MGDDLLMRPAARIRSPLTVLYGKTPGQPDVWGGWETRSFFHISHILYWLSQQQQSFHPAQRKRVSFWPLLTAGGGNCPATVAVSRVSQRIGVIPARLAREARHSPDHHGWVR